MSLIFSLLSQLTRIIAWPMLWIVHTHKQSNVHIIRYCHCSQIGEMDKQPTSAQARWSTWGSISMFQGRIMNKSNEILKTWQSCINKQASLENKYFSFSMPATNSRGELKSFEDRKYVFIIPTCLVSLHSCSVVRVSAQVPKGHKFESPSRVCTLVGGICEGGNHRCGRISTTGEGYRERQNKSHPFTGVSGSSSGSLGTIEVGWGGCPVHCRVWNRIPASTHQMPVVLYTCSLVMVKSDSGCCEMFPGSETTSVWESLF